MNISHIENSEQQNDYEYHYIVLANAAKHNSESSEPTPGKVLALLDDSTPNYVLGYN
jgi:hypothetical protein